MLDNATSEVTFGTKFGIDAMKRLRGEDHKRRWPPLMGASSGSLGERAGFTSRAGLLERAQL